MKFEGFSPETIDFLWGIRFNNNREWFAEHKSQYQQTLYEPMKALAKELEPDFASVPGLRLHISRIYRDMRMHPSHSIRTVCGSVFAATAERGWSILACALRCVPRAIVTAFSFCTGKRL